MVQSSQESYLQDLYQALHRTALVARFDSSGFVTDMNEKFSHLLGYKNNELVGARFTSLLSSRFPQELVHEILKNISKGSAWKGQLVHRTKSGETVWTEASIQPIVTEGSALRYVFIAFDITEQKEIEEALASSQKFLKKLMSSAPVGFFLADGKGQCQLVNDKWVEMTGLRLNRAAGMGWLEGVHEDDRERIAMAWNAMVNLNTSFHQEHRYSNPGKDVTTVFASAVVLVDDNNGTTQILRVEQDLSEQKKNEDMIEQQRAHMVSSAKLSTLGEMAGSIAHEINNPIAIIMGSAELLTTTVATPQPDPARITRLTSTILETTARIAKIIKSLHLLARDGDFDPFETRDLEGLFSSVAEMYSARARTHRIQVKILPIPAKMAIQCRPTQIAQALLNLISNSIFAVAGLDEKWVHIEVQDQGTTVQIIVTDSGDGIPAKDREKIFNPFFTTKKDHKSIGLGLSIAAGFIEAHKGTLQLDSTSPRTRFIVTLPKLQRTMTSLHTA